MDHLNALQQVSLKAGRVTLAGFSISGLATYVQVPELNACFDMGECPLSALPLDHVFLTHAHGDHVRCLPRHWQLRRMMGNTREPVYFVPEAVRTALEHWIRAEAALDAVPEAEIVLPRFHGLDGSESAVALPHRPDLAARAFPVHHPVASLGYTLLARKKKLRPEYTGLPGQEIARLRQAGTAVQDEVLDPLVTFIGDCDGRTLLEQEHIWSSPVLLLEATFVEPGSEPEAAAKGHCHLSDIARALAELGERVRVEHLVLKHFSMRYSPAEVAERVDAVIPAPWRDRVQLLLGR